MNNIIDKIVKKAGVIVCLFFSFGLTAQDWKFNETQQRAYNLALNLQTQEALDLIREPVSAADLYILALAESVELLVTEDNEKFATYADHFQNNIDKPVKGTVAEVVFVRAEMNLQWAAINLKFGHEFDAALNLREAYLRAEECRRKNPKFTPIRKTTGMLEILIGSVPEKHNWILNLMGMQGSVEKGISDLEIARKSSSPIAFEADIIYSLLEGFILQKAESGLKGIGRLQAKSNHQKILLFIGASMAMKNSQSELALSMLNKLDSISVGLPLPYCSYQKGEVYLHKAEYENAIAAYREFMESYKGVNYKKDALYKTGICYLLNGNQPEAMRFFDQARSSGKESVEADKYAAKNLQETELPHIRLSKVRYHTDGGYYNEAKQQLDEIKTTDLPTKRDQVEYYYRKGRLSHKLGELPAALLFYGQAIAMAGDENWYFAPNACLQSGFISLQLNKQEDAKGFFSKALSYKDHGYKNSIDSKAKTALAQMKRR